MEDITDKVKIEIKVNGKNALAANEKIFFEESDSGSMVIKTTLGSTQKQEFEMVISKYTECDDVQKED